MKKKISTFYYMTLAFATTYFMALTDKIGEAFAAYCPTTISYINYTGYCGPGNYVFESGSRCGTVIGNFCKTTEVPIYSTYNWTCSGEIGASSGYCVCSASTGLYTPNPFWISINCGTAYHCGDGSLRGVYCYNDGTSAGYKIGGGSSCACCPGASGLNGIGSLYSDYDATAATSCYVTGEFNDEAGLFQYTNENKCYYVS